MVDKNININLNTTYNTFIQKIELSNGLSYKIFNNEQEITSGNITKGMTLKIYYNDTLLDTYNIIEEFIDLSKLSIDDTNKIIRESKIGSKIKELKDKISTSGKITITDKDNKTLADTDIIKTGIKVKIELSSKTYEYQVSLKGEANGDGKISLTETTIAFRTKIKKMNLSGVYFDAIDMNNDNKITLTDTTLIFRKKNK